MKLLKILMALLLLQNIVVAQDAVHNFGSLQVHDGTTVGFHIDLINDGVFDNNLGLVGFYGYDKELTVSGTNAPVFYDSEVMVDYNLYLETPIEIINNGNLITGNIVTPRNNLDVYTNFIDNAFYVGEKDASSVDGYASLTNKDNFTFPVGDQKYLRPLSIASTIVNLNAKCAYFFESPNAPSTFGKSYQTDKKESEYLSVSDKEFWHLQGNVLSSVTLTWNERSDVRTLGQTIEDLKVVGWHKEDNEWVNLGNTTAQGSMNSGSITSDVFIPNDYELLTIGGSDKRLNEFITIELDNYFITPNGDGRNDYLVLDGLEKSPNNELKIFNRYGVLVYSELNYQNNFNGISNRNTVVSRGSGLASGVYFYIITMLDIRQRHQGYLYLSVTE
ncbi:gliding motility-associated C-terminal domain-containing protein [Aurantibacter crassamenti]|uniref:gliding motility-associated C-terminal domain-containing protein n=1 Tax=Aurantibacter crassamenti TaxID=1837375 RepID=UPI0019398889|nr:gliding motility-associated C-terminal domain-containing protein [Aurantibacter crassamenti]MBM1108060.1 gliding motility-associated C-terminal domain-containing protein [Aurantibacter crassamenti]